MKREFAIAGLALVVSILLSSPSIAQTSPSKTKPAAEPVAEVTTEASPELAFEEMSLDEAILFASTPEERARLLVRCIGPKTLPPMDMAAMEPPASEPAEILAQ